MTPSASSKTPDDLAVGVDRVDLCPLRAGHVDRRVDAFAQDEAMVRVVGIRIQSYDLAGVVDALGHGEGVRGRHVQRSCKCPSC